MYVITFKMGETSGIVAEKLFDKKNLFYEDMSPKTLEECIEAVNTYRNIWDQISKSYGVVYTIVDLESGNSIPIELIGGIPTDSE